MLDSCFLNKVALLNPGFVLLASLSFARVRLVPYLLQHLMDLCLALRLTLLACSSRVFLLVFWSRGHICSWWLPLQLFWLLLALFWIRGVLLIPIECISFLFFSDSDLLLLFAISKLLVAFLHYCRSWLVSFDHHHIVFYLLTHHSLLIWFVTCRRDHFHRSVDCLGLLIKSFNLFLSFKVGLQPFYFLVRCWSAFHNWIWALFGELVLIPVTNLMQILPTTSLVVERALWL